MSAADRIVTEDRRLQILLALALSPGYALAIETLHKRLKAGGYVSSEDRTRTDVAWLVEQGYAGATGEVITATRSGTEVATGDVSVPGVSRPLAAR